MDGIFITELQPGDVVECEVTGIGTLTNTVQQGTGLAPRLALEGHATTFQ